VPFAMTEPLSPGFRRKRYRDIPPPKFEDLKADDHQAFSNLIGIRTWAYWGSTMVWDTAFMLHFARYGHGAYPFNTGFDNCYARQHENSFICRESDRENREVYAGFPLHPALFSWAKWEYFQLSNDEDRLRDVLLPITRHYEWWMKYQRRPNGLYWTDGFNEADDSPRCIWQGSRTRWDAT
jgi:hypothetical protein